MFLRLNKLLYIFHQPLHDHIWYTGNQTTESQKQLPELRQGSTVTTALKLRVGRETNRTAKNCVIYFHIVRVSLISVFGRFFFPRLAFTRTTVLRFSLPFPRPNLVYVIHLIFIYFAGQICSSGRKSGKGDATEKKILHVSSLLAHLFGTFTVRRFSGRSIDKWPISLLVFLREGFM